MKTKIIITTAVLVLIAATTVKLMSNKRTAEANVYRPDTAKPVLVEADTASLEDFTRTFTYTGTFAPNKESMIIPQVQGQIRGLYFEEGDIVRQGTLLALVDDDLLQAQKLSAEATLANAKRNLERFEKASLTGGISGMQVDNSTLTMKTAEAQLKLINKQIALSRITAPFTGTITLKDVENGAVVGVSPIGRITDLSVLKLEVMVPEKEIMMFRKGEKTLIHTDIRPGQPVEGRIEFIASRADDAHNYMVRIAVKNEESLLKAGMYGTLSFEHSENEPTVMIPRTALLGSAKDPQVFVFANGVVELRNITTGNANATHIEVIEGITPGEIVVTSGHIHLEPGAITQISR